MKTTLMLLTAILISVPAFGLDYDQNITPDVIFGDGNANGSFTVDVQNSVELGLRAKLRFNAMNLPENTFNSAGDGTYIFTTGAPTGGAGWVAGTTPIWNFEFTVNVDVDGLGGNTLDDLTYLLGLDFDPLDNDPKTYLEFDPITPTVDAPFFDHSIGDNSSTEATDVVAGDGATYVNYLSLYNVAQNSWNYEFFNDGPFAGFDPNVPGVYDIYLKAFLGGNQVAHTAIKILVGGAVDNETTSWGEVKSLFR